MRPLQFFIVGSIGSVLCRGDATSDLLSSLNLQPSASSSGSAQQLQGLDPSGLLNSLLGASGGASDPSALLNSMLGSGTNSLSDLTNSLTNSMNSLMGNSGQSIMNSLTSPFSNLLTGGGNQQLSSDYGFQQASDALGNALNTANSLGNLAALPSSANSMLNGLSNLSDASGLTNLLGNLGTTTNTSNLLDTSNLLGGLGTTNTSSLLDTSALTNNLLGGLGTTNSSSLLDTSALTNSLNSLLNTNNLLGSTNNLLGTTNALDTSALTNSLNSLLGGLGTNNLLSQTNNLLGSTTTDANKALQGLIDSASSGLLGGSSGSSASNVASTYQGIADAYITNNYLNPTGQSAIMLSGLAAEAYNYPDLAAALQGQVPVTTSTGELTPAVQLGLRQMGISATTPADLVSAALTHSQSVRRRILQAVSSEFEQELKKALIQRGLLRNSKASNKNLRGSANGSLAAAPSAEHRRLVADWISNAMNSIGEAANGIEREVTGQKKTDTDTDSAAPTAGESRDAAAPDAPGDGGSNLLDALLGAGSDSDTAKAGAADASAVDAGEGGATRLETALDNPEWRSKVQDAANQLADKLDEVSKQLRSGDLSNQIVKWWSDFSKQIADTVQGGSKEVQALSPDSSAVEKIADAHAAGYVFNSVSNAENIQPLQAQRNATAHASAAHAGSGASLAAAGQEGRTQQQGQLSNAALQQLQQLQQFQQQQQQLKQQHQRALQEAAAVADAAAPAAAAASSVAAANDASALLTGSGLEQLEQRLQQQMAQLQQQMAASLAQLPQLPSLSGAVATQGPNPLAGAGLAVRSDASGLQVSASSADGSPAGSVAIPSTSQLSQQLNSVLTGNQAAAALPTVDLESLKSGLQTVDLTALSNSLSDSIAKNLAQLTSQLETGGVGSLLESMGQAPGLQSVVDTNGLLSMIAQAGSGAAQAGEAAAGSPSAAQRRLQLPTLDMDKILQNLNNQAAGAANLVGGVADLNTGLLTGLGTLGTQLTNGTLSLGTSLTQMNSGLGSMLGNINSNLGGSLGNLGSGLSNLSSNLGGLGTNLNEELMGVADKVNNGLAETGGWQGFDLSQLGQGLASLTPIPTNATAIADPTAALSEMLANLNMTGLGNLAPNNYTKDPQEALDEIAEKSAQNLQSILNSVNLSGQKIEVASPSELAQQANQTLQALQESQSQLLQQLLQQQDGAAATNVKTDELQGLGDVLTSSLLDPTNALSQLSGQLGLGGASAVQSQKQVPAVGSLLNAGNQLYQIPANALLNPVSVTADATNQLSNVLTQQMNTLTNSMADGVNGMASGVLNPILSTGNNLLGGAGLLNKRRMLQDPAAAQPDAAVAAQPAAEAAIQPISAQLPADGIVAPATLPALLEPAPEADAGSGGALDLSNLLGNLNLAGSKTTTGDIYQDFLQQQQQQAVAQQQQAVAASSTNDLVSQAMSSLNSLTGGKSANDLLQQAANSLSSLSSASSSNDLVQQAMNQLNGLTNGASGNQLLQQAMNQINNLSSNTFSSGNDLVQQTMNQLNGLTNGNDLVQQAMNQLNSLSSSSLSSGNDLVQQTMNQLSGLTNGNDVVQQAMNQLNGLSANAASGTDYLQQAMSQLTNSNQLMQQAMQSLNGLTSGNGLSGLTSSNAATDLTQQLMNSLNNLNLGSLTNGLTSSGVNAFPSLPDLSSLLGGLSNGSSSGIQLQSAGKGAPETIAMSTTPRQAAAVDEGEQAQQLQKLVNALSSRNLPVQTQQLAALQQIPGATTKTASGTATSTQDALMQQLGLNQQHQAQQQVERPARLTLDELLREIVESRLNVTDLVHDVASSGVDIDGLFQKGVAGQLKADDVVQAIADSGFDLDGFIEKIHDSGVSANDIVRSVAGSGLSIDQLAAQFANTKTNINQALQQLADSNVDVDKLLKTATNSGISLEQLAQSGMLSNLIATSASNPLLLSSLAGIA